MPMYWSQYKQSKKSPSRKTCTKKVNNENEATEKTTDDCTQYEHNNQKKNTEHRSTQDETVAIIHDCVGNFDDVNRFDPTSDQHCDEQDYIGMDLDVNATET